MSNGSAASFVMPNTIGMTRAQRAVLAGVRKKERCWIAGGAVKRFPTFGVARSCPRLGACGHHGLVALHLIAGKEGQLADRFARTGTSHIFLLVTLEPRLCGRSSLDIHVSAELSRGAALGSTYVSGAASERTLSPTRSRSSRRAPGAARVRAQNFLGSPRQSLIGRETGNHSDRGSVGEQTGPRDRRRLSPRLQPQRCSTLHSSAPMSPVRRIICAAPPLQ